jgi:Ni,Fe-hydrogenase III large subunit
MNGAEIIRAAPAQPCVPWPRHVLDEASWRVVAGDPAPLLLAMWADLVQVHALFLDEPSGAVLPASVTVAGGRYPALSPHRPAASWFERMIRDLWGHEAEGARDLRPWLDHGRWPHHAPLAARPRPVNGLPQPPEFLPAEGDDLHQIPVGPVHAGIIEPGHFRFTVQGETVVRLEARLGYLHKGTISLVLGKSPRVAARFAARLSGDSTVAHGIAFAHAVEAASEVAAPPRAVALRAVMAEMERLANHLGDIGAIANDAAFAFLPARFGWHREAMLRAAAAAFGHRLMMDCVVPGGVIVDIAAGGKDAIHRALDAVDAELPDLLRVYDNYASLVDRTVGTGIIPAALAQAFGAGGYVGRAAGRDADVRRAPGYPPYDTLVFAVPVLQEGDVDARVRIRAAEIRQSVALLRTLLAALPDGPLIVPLPNATGEGIGWSEGFRGDIWHWLRLENGLISAYFPRDPSWLHWPLIEAAIRNNIVADFPLCNKSFNAAYSGVDL